jgi:hypothetical protein
MSLKSELRTVAKRAAVIKPAIAHFATIGNFSPCSRAQSMAMS